MQELINFNTSRRQLMTLKSIIWHLVIYIRPNKQFTIMKYFKSSIDTIFGMNHSSSAQTSHKEGLWVECTSECGKRSDFFVSSTLHLLHWKQLRCMYICSKNLQKIVLSPQIFTVQLVVLATILYVLQTSQLFLPKAPAPILFTEWNLSCLC